MYIYTQCVVSRGVKEIGSGEIRNIKMSLK